MNRRFKARRKELEASCTVSPNAFVGIRERLAKFSEPFIEGLLRKEQQKYASMYMEGLLSDLERKNAESIAYHHDQDRRNLQYFVGQSSWDYEPLSLELARQIGQEIGESDGVIVFDPSGFKKQGKHSVGVARQWLGREGKVDNGQVAVYMGYVSSKEHALVDVRLYLSKEWARDRKRRKACGVPKEIRFQTRHEQALEMLKEKGPLLPHKWCAGDDEMGRSTQFRRELRARNELYVLAVPSNTNIRDLEEDPPLHSGKGRPAKVPFRRVDNWRAAVPSDEWTEVNVRDGEKGPLKMKVAKTRVLARTERKGGESGEELLVVACSQDENGKPKHDYFLSNAASDTPVEELARVIQAEHRIEECIKRGKHEAGLRDYEVRTWMGWHHHQVLSLISIWFLILETKRGKKENPCAHGPAGSNKLRDDLERCSELWTSSAHSPHHHTKTRKKRASAILSLEKAQPVGSP